MKPRLFLDGVELKPLDGLTFTVTFMTDQRKMGRLLIDDQELDVWIIQSFKINSLDDIEVLFYCYTKKVFMLKEEKTII